MADTNLRATLVALLSEIQDGREIRAYLDRFGAAGQSRFAVIKVGGAVLDKQMDQLARALSLLHTLGLTPIVVHGAGPQLDQALTAKGLDAGKLDGLRVTTPEIMRVVASVSRKVGGQLTAAIRKYGGAAALVSPTAITARLRDEKKYGRVGDVIDLDKDHITTLSASGHIPVLSCVAVDENGQTVNVNADTMAREVVTALKPLKIVYLTGVPGLLDANGEVISAINLEAELEDLEVTGVVRDGMQFKLREIRTLLQNLPETTSVSITSPEGLVGELFTHAGRGTLVRRGEQINTLHTKAKVDENKLCALVEEAFGRTLRTGYFDQLPLRRAYVAAGYRAAAVVTEVNGEAVLDKFAVAKSARGAGLSHALWRKMTQDHPVLFWRSRRNNPFNEFYHEHAEGSVRRGAWTVFWTGAVSLSDIDHIVVKVGDAEESFIAEEDERVGKPLVSAAAPAME